MQSSRVVFPPPHLRKLRRALHSDNGRSLRCAQNPLRPGNSPLGIVSLFYGSVRAVKVLLASLRSTLTPAPSAGKRSLGFHAKKFVAAENETNGSVPRTKPLRLLTKMSRSFILQDTSKCPP